MSTMIQDEMTVTSEDLEVRDSDSPYKDAYLWSTGERVGRLCHDEDRRKWTAELIVGRSVGEATATGTGPERRSKREATHDLAKLYERALRDAQPDGGVTVAQARAIRRHVDASREEVRAAMRRLGVEASHLAEAVATLARASKRADASVNSLGEVQGRGAMADAACARMDAAKDRLAAALGLAKTLHVEVETDPVDVAARHRL